MTKTRYPRMELAEYRPRFSLGALLVFISLLCTTLAQSPTRTTYRPTRVQYSTKRETLRWTDDGHALTEVKSVNWPFFAPAAFGVMILIWSRLQSRAAFPG